MENVPPNERPTKWVHLKHLAALIAAMAGFATAVGAYLRPETGARKGYDALASTLEEQSIQIRQNHEDMLALRGYIDGLYQAQQRGVRAEVTPPVGTVSSQVVEVKPLAPPPPPPPVHAKLKTVSAPSYKAVVGKEDL